MNENMSNITLKDDADVFVRTSPVDGKVKVCITRSNRNTQQVYTPTQASLARIASLLIECTWKVAGVRTFSGWTGYRNY